ncbi:hypothetical protein LSCM1_08164 [Leishmania martiniquensis]|uniref:Thioredoxin domain-containing protein n=1 Tax=Leishmania martiniquensis TaxID=1580590 RepID=A0A836H926_9TRYP|nr:hypothetical protein LSCM1_08164 [Leishmania martiniquensis]
MPFTEVYGVEQFRELANRPVLTVVCFSAVWCGPCKTIERELDRLTYEFSDVCFAKVDADHNTEIVSKCRVMQLPTFMLVRAGQMLGYVIGADVMQLKAKIREEARKS